MKRKSGKDNFHGGGGRKSKHFKAAAAAKGSPGILVSCDQSREREGVKEAMNLFEQYAEELFPSSSEAEGSDGKSGEKMDRNESIQDQLAKEIAELKKSNAPSKRRFEALDTGVKGIIFFSVADSKVDPVVLVNAIIADYESSGQAQSRYISRLIPLQETCHASIESIKESANKLLPAFFKGKKGLRYFVDFKKRNCSNVGRMEVIDACVEVVQELYADHKPIISEPDAVIVVEIFKTVCGLSVLDINQYKRKFSLRLAVDKVKATNDAKESASKESASKESASKEGSDSEAVEAKK